MGLTRAPRQCSASSAEHWRGAPSNPCLGLQSSPVPGIKTRYKGCGGLRIQGLGLRGLELGCWGLGCRGLEYMV